MTQTRLPVRRRKSLLPRTLGLAINLLLGEHPPGRFGQVPRHGDHRLLVILAAFDSLIQPYHVASCEPALVDHYQIADLYKSPFQISVYWVDLRSPSLGSGGRCPFRGRTLPVADYQLRSDMQRDPCCAMNGADY